MTTAPTLLDSRYSWFRLGVTLLIATAGNAGMWAVVMVLPAMQQEFQLDRAMASVPYILTMLGFAWGSVVMGRVSDRYGITRAMILAAALVAAGFVLAALAPGVPLLSAAHFVIGVGTATGFGPLIADISHWFLKRRGLAVAVAASGNYLSGVVWPLALTGVLEGQGWRAAYLVLALASLALVVPLALLLRRPLPAAARHAAERQAQERRAASGLAPGRLQGLLVLAGIGCCVAMAVPQVHIVALAKDLGFGTVAGARMLSLMLAGGVVSRLASGVLADRLGGVRTLLMGSVLQTLALALFLPFDSVAALYGASLVFGLAQGGIVPSYAVIVREFLPAAEAGRRVGLVMMATILGMALGGWMAGWLRDLSGSYDLAFGNGIVWNLMNIAIMLAVLRAGRRGGGHLAAVAA